MWKCSKCGRVFERKDQPHSYKKVTLEDHFKNKDAAKSIFDVLLKKMTADVGKCKVISLPCCIHLFGEYDFLAALPKKDRLEIRFGLHRALPGPKIKQAVQTSMTSFKNCIDIKSKDEIDNKLMSWLSEAYFLKSR